MATRSNRESRKASTSATAGTWTVAIPFNRDRNIWRIHNLPNSGANLEVAYQTGATPADNAETMVLVPGGVIEEASPSNISTQSIVVRSTVASLLYYAVEG